MTINNAGSEKYLLETLDRISKNSSKYCAVYVSISKLRPKNRHPEFIKVLAKLFDSLIGAAMGSFFVLSNGDFVILGSKVSQQMVDETINKLKKSMSKDPIVHTTNTSSFVKLYTFPDDLANLYVAVTSVAISQPEVNDEENLIKPLENYQVENILTKMAKVDFSKIIKRQSVLKILSSTKFEVLSQEFFIAIKDLSKELSSNIDLTSNKWMFIYLTEELDKKALSAMFHSGLKTLPKEISLNLNLSSIFSNEFINFTQNFLKDETSLTVEVQLMDIFNNLNLYFEVKDLLHQAGYKILIDAVTPSVLKMINFKTLEPDLVKFFWEPLMEFDTNNEDIKALVSDVGKENIILAKCSDAKAIKWGVSHGIKAFQGPYMDEIEVAIIKSSCPNRNICTNLSCLKRKRLISGSLRNECQHINVLETLLEG